MQDDAQSASATTPTERTFATVVDCMFDALLILSAVRDPDGAVVDFAYDYANGAVAEHFGYRPSELVGTTMASVVPDVQNTEVFAKLVHVVETGAPMDLVVDHYTGPRTTGAFELRARRVEDRIALTIRNVTERRVLEAFVEQSETHLRQVIDALPVGVVVVNVDGQGIYLNTEGRRIMAVEDRRAGDTQTFSELYGLKKEFTGEPYPGADASAGLP